MGYALNQLQRHEEAELYCRQAIQINAERHNAFKNLGVALEELGQNEEAALQYAQATVLRPTDTRAFDHLERLMDAHSGLPESVANIRAQLLDLLHDRGMTRVTAAEAKATAAVYAQLGSVLEYVRSNGQLPDTIDSVNASTILRTVVENRGADINLTPDEQLVYSAMIKEGRMHGGIAQLSDATNPIWHSFKRS